MLKYVFYRKIRIDRRDTGAFFVPESQFFGRQQNTFQNEKQEIKGNGTI